MKDYAIIAATVLLAALLLIQYFRNRATQVVQPQPAQSTQAAQHEARTTDEVVQQLAAEAVKDAEKESGVRLDYTPESIKRVDQILGEVHEKYVKSPASISVRGLAAAYGAYIGEVIRKSEPDVHWERDDDLGKNIYPLEWKNVGSVYPMAWCQKRIENGDEDNVWMKYSVFKSQQLSNK